MATKSNLESGQNKMVQYSMIENVTLGSLPWILVANLISKGTTFRSYVPVKD